MMNWYKRLPAVSAGGARVRAAAGECTAANAERPSAMPRCCTSARVLLLTAVFAVLGVAVCGTAHAAPVKPGGPVGTAADCPWLNPHLPIAKRVAMLMQKMTVADEIGMVEGHGVHPYVGVEPANPALCIPAPNLCTGSSFGTLPESCIDLEMNG